MEGPYPYHVSVSAHVDGLYFTDPIRATCVVFTVGTADAVSIDLRGECSCLIRCFCYNVDSMSCTLH